MSKNIIITTDYIKFNLENCKKLRNSANILSEILNKISRMDSFLDGIKNNIDNDKSKLQSLKSLETTSKEVLNNFKDIIKNQKEVKYYGCNVVNNECNNLKNLFDNIKNTKNKEFGEEGENGYRKSFNFYVGKIRDNLGNKYGALKSIENAKEQLKTLRNAVKQNISDINNVRNRVC